MSQKILIKRGIKNNLPTLDVGEFGFSTDSKELFIGSDVGNKQVSMHNELKTSFVNLDLYKSLGVNVGLDNEDWSIAIQKSHDDIVSSGESGTIFIPYDIQIMDTFNWDVRKVSLIGYGATIKVKIADNTKYAIQTISSETGNPYNQATTKIDGVKIVGDRQCKGIKFDGGLNNSGASHITIMNSSISNFIEGLYYGVHAYLITFMNCDIYECDKIVKYPTSEDSGEKVSFINSTLYNSGLALDIDNPNADVYLINCSLDYNQQICNVNAGKLFLNNCHVEGRNDITDRQFLIGVNGSLVVDGGWIVYTNGALNIDYILENNASGKLKAIFKNASMNACITTTGKFATGNGKTIFENINMNSIDEMPSNLSLSDNLLIDGSFEGNVITDNIYISGDTQPIVGKVLSGTNINLSLTSERAKSGSKCLKVSKTYGGGSQASFNIVVPMKRYSTPGFEITYSKNGGSGTVYIALSYGKYQDGEIKKLVNFATGTVNTDTMNNIDWSTFKIGSDRPSLPSWANCFIVTVNMDGFNNLGSMYFDDVVVTEM